MIHTLEVSYGLEMEDAVFCTHRLNEITNAFKDKGYFISNFLDKKKKSKPLIFTVPWIAGLKAIRLSKHIEDTGTDNSYAIFRIYFVIEAEVLRTGTDTLDLYFGSPRHAKQLQTQYAKAIYNLFPEAFNKRPAQLLCNSGFAPKESFTDKDEFNHSGLYALPYLPLASVRRLDMTFDLVSEDEEHAKLLTKMVGMSYYDGQKKKEQQGESKNPDNDECYDKVYASGSRSFYVYYKYDRMFDEAYKDRQNIKQIQEDSRNITRLEMSYTSQNRSNVKSLTWLQVPDGELPLGPLSYLASEQVPLNAFDKEYNGRIGYNKYNCNNLNWFKLHKLYDEVNNRVKAGIFKAKEGSLIKKLARAIHKEGSLKPVRKLINGKKCKKRPCSPGTYRKHRNLAMKNGIMLEPIPDDSKFSELSAVPVFRNYSYDEAGSQSTTHMLPYQSVVESAPELEPVKDLYDAILKFLYEKYDQYAASHNTNYEAAKICPGDPRYPSDILEE